MKNNNNLKYTTKQLTKFFLNNFEYFFIILLTIGYFFLFSGYNYYQRDQTTQLPAILHFFDNELYQKDFEMQILNPASVKMIPHLILFSISKFTKIPTYIIYVAAYLITSFFIFFLIYKISFRLFSSKGIGLLACILLLFINNKSSAVSYFDIITSYLKPCFISVPFHLLCLYLVLQSKYKSSVFISALLFYIHGQNSIFSFIAIFLVILLFARNVKLLIKSTCIYLVLISPMLVSLFNNFNPFTGYVAKYSLLQLTKFRLSHHLLPGWNDVGKFVGLILCIILLLHINKTNKKFKYWIYSLILITILGIIFSKFIPIDAILLMYPLRVDVFLRIFFVILLSGGIFQLIRIGFKKKDIFIAILKNKYKITIVILIILFSITFLFIIPNIHYPYILPQKNDLTDISNYIKNHTPKDILIISPPFVQGVRLYTQRSNVVDFKTHPIGRGKKIQDEWVDRLAALCNVTQSNSDIFQGIRNCKYNSLSKEEYLLLCKKYDADYFITYVNNKYWRDILIYNNNVFGFYKCIK